jgi:ferric-dicitrate binding protein FerR (iron transport regulator)
MQRDHTNEFDPAVPVTEQALFWWVLLNEGDATAADHRAFGEWVTRSPERVEAYLQAARLSSALQSRKTKWPAAPVDELIRAARSTSGEVVNLPNSGTRVPARRGPLITRPRLVLVCVAALAVVGVILSLHRGPQRLETAVGEQRSVVLADGSLVTLNTSSSIEVRMVKDHRTVRLLAGEALFKVAHDTARPFDVTTGETTVRAVGTQFDVDRRPASTTVTVVEGRVAVFTGPEGQQKTDEARLPLEAGEQLTVAPRIARRPVRADVATAIAWTQRKLIFEHRPLGEVAAEFNRYNHQLIEIRSPELRHQEVTGVFQANDPVSFLTFLSGLPGVSVAEAPDHSRFVVTQEK